MTSLKDSSSARRAQGLRTGKRPYNLDIPSQKDDGIPEHVLLPLFQRRLLIHILQNIEIWKRLGLIPFSFYRQKVLTIWHYLVLGKVHLRWILLTLAPKFHNIFWRKRMKKREGGQEGKGRRGDERYLMAL